MACNKIFVSSSIGTLSISEKDGAIHRIELIEKIQGSSDDCSSPLLRRAAMQIGEYFEGKRRKFDFPIHPEGSPFDMSVWNALLEIPYGTTVNYGEIARRIGKPDASRAVGGAVGRNPLLIVIPCHRVIRSDGSIGGFTAGIESKKILLQTEGSCHFELEL